MVLNYCFDMLIKNNLFYKNNVIIYLQIENNINHLKTGY